MGRGGSGRLYVVATPIGNLSDLTPRAAQVLSSVEVVACEDTRRARTLLNHASAVPERVLALHDHNEPDASRTLLELLQGGADAALISDAGTPLVSDPGLTLLRMAWGAGIDVVPVPGASAVTTALAVSPIAVDRFRFEGFLPHRPTARRRALRELLESSVAVVFFEAPHRMAATLEALDSLGAGARPLLLCRELTKRFETLSYGTVATLRSDDLVLDRGEFTAILAPAESAPAAAASTRRVVDALMAELPVPQAARLAARITGRPRTELYALAVSLAADKE